MLFLFTFQYISFNGIDFVLRSSGNDFQLVLTFFLVFMKAIYRFPKAVLRDRKQNDDQGSFKTSTDFEKKGPNLNIKYVISRKIKAGETNFLPI